MSKYKNPVDGWTEKDFEELRNGTIGNIDHIVATYNSTSGSSFDYNYAASGCVVAVNYTVLHCRSMVGIGSNLSWSMSIDGIRATTNDNVDSALPNPSIMSSYALPVLTEVVGDGSSVNPRYVTS